MLSPQCAKCAGPCIAWTTCCRSVSSVVSMKAGTKVTRMPQQLECQHRLCQKPAYDDSMFRMIAMDLWFALVDNFTNIMTSSTVDLSTDLRFSDLGTGPAGETPFGRRQSWFRCLARHWFRSLKRMAKNLVSQRKQTPEAMHAWMVSTTCRSCRWASALTCNDSCFFLLTWQEAVLSRGNPAANVPMLDMLPISSEAPRDLIFSSISSAVICGSLAKPFRLRKNARLNGQRKRPSFWTSSCLSLSLWPLGWQSLKKLRNEHWFSLRRMGEEEWQPSQWWTVMTFF